MPEDAWSGNLRIGDEVIHIRTGQVYIVKDLVQTDVQGKTMAVFIGEKEYYDISEFSKK